MKGIYVLRSYRATVRAVSAGLAGAFCTILLPLVANAQASLEWSPLAYRLSAPGGVVRYQPYLVADTHGTMFAFWSEDSGRPCCLNGQFSLLRGARFDGAAWSDPVDIQRVVDGRIEHAAFAIDPADTLHAIWVQRAGPPELYYSSVPVTHALTSSAWTTPKSLDIVDAPGGLRLRIDDSGQMHFLFRQAGDLFYSRSSDGSSTWTPPALLDGAKPADFEANYAQLELDHQGGLHAVWHHTASGVGRRIQYVRSTNGGLTWSAPVTIDEFDPATDDPLTDSVRNPYGFTIAGDAVHVLWVGGPPGGPTGVGRKHRVSNDLGSTWSPTAVSTLDGVWGVQNGDGLAADSQGQVYWTGMARNWVFGDESGPPQLREGLWFARWEDSEWSSTEPLVDVLSPGIDSPRLLASPDGQLLTAFRNFPQPEALYATHTSGPHFYFPHYADGDGWSMQLVVNNLSSAPSSGALRIFDANGNPQELPFEGGSASQVDLDMAPYSTKVLRTLGTSAPLRTGYIRVDLDQAEISGLAVFQNANGTEASVLPEQMGRRYALLVETSASLKTGVAFARQTPAQPVTLTLFDLDGNIVDSQEFNGSFHTGRFVDELFPQTVVPGFRGLLLLESEALFSAMGLRLGSGILSTLPVTDLDRLQGGTFFFPHYADGDQLSMHLSVSNLAGAPTTGTISVFTPDGVPEDLPFTNGSASQLAVNLQPNSAGITETTGASVPLKTGFIQVELDQDEVSGLAIFRYPDGREASVLPSYPGKRFALYVERTADFDTGVAIARTETFGVTLRLYDETGTLWGSREYEFDIGDYQRARFLREMFPTLPDEFRGTLIMESDGDLTTLGLRFGGNVLSTIPVTRIE